MSEEELNLLQKALENDAEEFTNLPIEAQLVIYNLVKRITSNIDNCPQNVRAVAKMAMIGIAYANLLKDKKTLAEKKANGN